MSDSEDSMGTHSTRYRALQMQHGILLVAPVTAPAVPVAAAPVDAHLP